MATAKFCLSNRKGGVGKTTCSIHIAGALSDRGNDVLLVDLDPQGTATRGLGYDEYYSDIERETTLHDVLLEFEGRERINQLIREHPEFDLVPSHKKMTYDVGSKLDGEPRGEDRLELALDELDGEYDFILIDCPPSLDLLADNALLATKNVLIPTYPEELSVQGFDLLFDQIDELERWHEVEIRELGLIANRIENNNEADEYLDLFHDNFGEMWNVWEVRKRVSLQRSIAQGKGSIFGAEEPCDMQEVFTDIAKTLEEDLARPPAEVAE
jgi:chromosome partitioning protein